MSASVNSHRLCIVINLTSFLQLLIVFLQMLRQVLYRLIHINIFLLGLLNSVVYYELLHFISHLLVLLWVSMWGSIMLMRPSFNCFLHSTFSFFISIRGLLWYLLCFFFDLIEIFFANDLSSSIVSFMSKFRKLFLTFIEQRGRSFLTLFVQILSFLGTFRS